MAGNGVLRVGVEHNDHSWGFYSMVAIASEGVEQGMYSYHVPGMAIITCNTLMVPSMSAERHRSTSRRAILSHSNFRVSGSGAMFALAFAMSVSTTHAPRYRRSKFFLLPP